MSLLDPFERLFVGPFFALGSFYIEKTRQRRCADTENSTPICSLKGPFWARSGSLGPSWAHSGAISHLGPNLDDRPSTIDQRAPTSDHWPLTITFWTFPECSGTVPEPCDAFMLRSQRSRQPLRNQIKLQICYRWGPNLVF